MLKILPKILIPTLMVLAILNTFHRHKLPLLKWISIFWLYTLSVHSQLELDSEDLHHLLHLSLKLFCMFRIPMCKVIKANTFIISHESSVRPAGTDTLFYQNGNFFIIIAFYLFQESTWLTRIMNVSSKQVHLLLTKYPYPTLFWGFDPSYSYFVCRSCIVLICLFSHI